LACDAGAHAFAAVALVPAIPGKDLLTYRVAAADAGRVRPGVRVIVPLGRRHETAIVVRLDGEAPAGVATIRPIVEVLDDAPIVTPELFALCRWAADYYMTSLADVLAAALPGAFRAASTRIVRLAEPTDPVSTLRHAASPGASARGIEGAVLAHLASSGPISVTALSRALRRPVANAVRALAARATVVVEEQLRPPAGKTRFATVLALARVLAGDEVAALGRRAPRQRAV
jgi:primosomal protein N' (replication factor Y)